MIKIVAWVIGGFMGTAAIVGAFGNEPQPSTQLDPAPVVTETKPEKIAEIKSVTETEIIAFETVYVSDSNLAEGKSQTRTEGKNGTKILTYEVTYENGVEVDRKLIKEEVTAEPIDKVIARGTKKPAPTSNCDPNYTGACVPIASDVDCAGGSGNGPAYVWGPVYVVGYDIYDLDRDGDGVGCEN